VNRAYRLKWNEILRTWVAVSEITLAHGKRAAGALLLCVGPVLAAPPAPTELPTGGQVSAGQAVITQSAARMDINQSSQRAVIDWQTFNIGSQAHVNFNQPSASSVTLNRVLDTQPSQIFGRLTSNGQVFLTNPNGVYFSPNASVDVGALVATTHGISNADFMAGRYSFSRNGATGGILNEGRLKAALGGYIALLAPEVRNQGVVIAQMGTVALAAGEAYELQFDGNNTLANLRVTPATIKTLVANGNAVQAPGGLVILSAQGVNQVQGSVVNAAGVIEARGITSQGGRIFLDAGEGGETTVSGTLDASSDTAQGGQITVTGETVRVAGTARLDASGASGGGTVLVGGSWQGSDSTIRQAATTTVEQGARLMANAMNRGNGGTVVAWSDINNPLSSTYTDGIFEARGGLSGGDGGRIETSGHRLKIGDATRVTTLASAGQNGRWLLDPYDFTVASSGGDITGSALSTALGAANVTIQTANASVSCTNATCGAGTSTGVGDIFVNDTVTWSANTLTLNAYNNIWINGTVTGSGTSTLALLYGQKFTDDSASNSATNLTTYTVKGSMSASNFSAKYSTSANGATTYTTTLPTYLNNGYLRFGNGIQSSVNSLGLLLQPYYYDSVSKTWYKLTYQNNPLNTNIGVGGSTYAAATIVTSASNAASFAAPTIDTTSYANGRGTVVATNTVTVNTATVQMQNTYSLAAGNAYITVTTKLTNTTGSAIDNVRLWVGTQDDFVRNTDTAVIKTRGNLSSSGFTAITSASDQAKALQITASTTSTDGGVLFFSTSSGANTLIKLPLGADFQSQDPSTSSITATGDDSYALYNNFGSLANGGSAQMAWYYAGGNVSDLTTISTSINSVAVPTTTTTTTTTQTPVILPPYVPPPVLPSVTRPTPPLEPPPAPPPIPPIPEFSPPEPAPQPPVIADVPTPPPTLASIPPSTPLPVPELRLDEAPRPLPSLRPPVAPAPRAELPLPGAPETPQPAVSEFLPPPAFKTAVTSLQHGLSDGGRTPPAVSLDTLTTTQVNAAVNRGLAPEQATQTGKQFNQVLVQQLARGVPMAEAVVAAERVFQAESGFPPPKSPQEAAIKTLASSGFDVDAKLNSLANTKTAAGASAFDKALSVALQKGMGFDAAVRTAQQAGQQTDQMVQVERTPINALASGNAASEQFGDTSSEFQKTLSAMLAKGMPLAQATQKANAASRDSALAARSDRGSPKSGLASGDLSMLDGRDVEGPFGKVLSTALAKGIPVSEAMSRANQADAMEQRANQADARSELTGFAGGRGAVPKVNPDFDRALSNAINRGASPERALAIAKQSVNAMPRDVQTASTSLASGRSMDALLSSPGNSRAFRLALGNALAKGMPVEKALALARKAEDMSAFRFPLSGPAARLAAARNAKLLITTAEGKPLPAWLRYAPESRSFIASDVPEGGFPLAVVIKVAGKLAQLTITEGAVKKR
jgi:filamentous hemagglutinin family protein